MGKPFAPGLMPTLLAICCLVLLAACSDPFQATPLPTDARILAFGDSITFGTGRGDGLSYPDHLAQATGFTVVNAGIPGDTAARGKNRIAAVMDRQRPDMVILELGGNDFLARTREKQIKDDLQAIIDAIRARKIPVVLVAVPEFSVLRATTGSLQDASIYRELADANELLLIEELLADILSDADLRSDPIHPNARGYRQLASGIEATLRDANYLPEL